MIIHGDCLEQLKLLEENSVDAVVTDPPYGWRFMGKAWDAPDIDKIAKQGKRPGDTFIGPDGCTRKTREYTAESAGKYDLRLSANRSFQEWTETWAREAFRVLKPGGHIIIFCGPRTYHRMASGIEDAGFEIRDQVQWLYGSGFPKSQNIALAIDKQAGAVGHRGKAFQVAGAGEREDIQGTTGELALPSPEPITDAAKQWQGWGTALKPANEPICLARKPISEKTVASNVLLHGTGGLNIDASRVSSSPEDQDKMRVPIGKIDSGNVNMHRSGERTETFEPNFQGRWPANLILDEDAAAMLDEQTGNLGKSAGGRTVKRSGKYVEGKVSAPGEWTNEDPGYGDSGGASRFFYVAKASKKERNAGLGETIIWDGDVWLKQDLNSVLTAISLLVKDISAEALMVNRQWSTGTFGSPQTDEFPQDLTFTISTVSKLIIDLRTSSASQNSTIKENIQGVTEILLASGLNLVESVTSISQLLQNTMPAQTALALGAVNAVLTMLSQISAAAKQGNFHSTVKPIKLMEYLIRLITPPGGIVLDPFMGSGSTGVAAKNLGFEFIGIEMNEEYIEIAKRRIDCQP